METEEIIPSILDRKFRVDAAPSTHRQPPHPPDEAFTAKYIPDMGYDVKDFQVFHWKLQGWEKLEKGLTSSEFYCGGRKWCVLSGYPHLSHLGNLKFRPRQIFLFPLSNTLSPNDTTFIYLDYANSKGMEKDWHTCAQFALAISNPHDPTNYTVNCM